MRIVLACLLLIVFSLGIVCAQTVSDMELPDKPLLLDDCIKIALENNPQITSSKQGVISARAGLVRARSSYYPQVSASASEGIADSGSGSDTYEDGLLTTRLTLWQLGRNENLKQTKASLTATEFGHITTVRDLVEQVSRDYYAVLAAQELVGVAQAGVESAQGHLDQVRARVKLGAAAEVDVFPVEDDLARAELDVIDVQGALRSAVARLKNDMGLSPRSSLELAETAEVEEISIPSLDDAIEIGMNNRTELKGAEASLRASRYSLTQAKIARGPEVDISGQHQQSYTDWDRQDPSWDVSLSLSWPLFDGFATKADVVAAKASLKRSEADRQRVVNQVGLEVENAIVDAERTQQSLQATAKSVAAAEARLTAAEGKYQQGVGILLEVIDARVAVTNALANQVRARYDNQIALVGLQRALGLLEPPKTGE